MEQSLSRSMDLFEAVQTNVVRRSEDQNEIKKKT